MTATSADELKRQVGERLAAGITPGQLIGVGTGSTVTCAIEALGKRVREEGLALSVITTSRDSTKQCAEAGLSVLDPSSVTSVDVAFDGADEVLRGPLYCIKGKGGAHTREKFVAAKAKKFIVIVDGSKLVETLGQKFPVPVEVFPELSAAVTDALRELGATKVSLRPCEGGKFGAIITELGNVILDAWFPAVKPDLEREIKAITGVVENGLFVRHRPHEVLVAGTDGNISVLHPVT